MSGKKYSEKLKLVDRGKLYSPDEAVKLVKETALAKFDETVDLAVRLGVDVKKGDQQVRGTVLLPAGTGKSVKVLVITKGEKVKEAETAGADYAGGEELIEKINSGWMDFDMMIASPDVMGAVGKLGKILGPKGLMPSPKSGTVTFDIAKTVKEFKAGKLEFKIDKAGVLHLSIGKVSFDLEKIQENFLAAVEAIIKAKPSSCKGVYVRSLTLSSTMGPGIKISPQKALKIIEEAQD